MCMVVSVKVGDCDAGWVVYVQVVPWCMSWSGLGMLGGVLGSVLFLCFAGDEKMW